MKRVISLLLAALLMLLCIPSFGAEVVEEGRCLLYIATDGDDSNDGSIENPLLTLQAARNKIRQMKQTGNYPKGYTVYVRGGTYNISESFILEEQDSGTDEAPIMYCAYGNEKVVLSGGVTVSGKEFSKTTDTAVLNRIIESSARDKIYMLDLKNYGITDVGETYWKGAYSYPSKFIEAGIVQKPNAPGSDLLFNDKAMTIARYPNSGNITIETVVNEGWTSTNPDNLPITTPFTISVSDDRIAKWNQAVEEGNALMYGYWRYIWADQTVPIKAIDSGKQEITGKFPGVFGVLPGKSFYVYNLIEEMDQPGEYYLDNKNGILYIYPPEELESAEVTVTLLDQPMIQMQDTEYITFKDIDILGTRSSAYLISGGSHNLITDCEISFTAQRAVAIRGFDNGISNSYIHDVEGGVSLYGGDLPKLIPGNCFVENCEIERFSRLSGTYVSAVNVGSTGNYVRYNEIHDAPHVGIEIGGVDNHIIYNEIYDVVKNTEDSAAIYGGLSWIDRGIEISYNYIHDIKTNLPDSEISAGVGGIYLDGGMCEITMVGNVFENILGWSGRALWLNGGRDNIFKNNVIINCGSGLFFNDIMLSVDLSVHHYPGLNEAPYVNTCPWKRKYPKLQRMLRLSDEEKKLPEGNLVVNNVCYNTELANETTRFSGQNVPVAKYVDLTNNYVTNNDPGFVSLESGDYAFKQDALVFEILSGFENIPFNQMGTTYKPWEDVDAKMLVMKIASPYAFCDEEKQMIVRENVNVTPIQTNGIVYIPVRFTAESFGMQVAADSQSATLSNANQTIIVDMNGDNCKINGVSSKLHHPTFILNNSLMISVEDISDLLQKNYMVLDNGLIIIDSQMDRINELCQSEDKINSMASALSIY